jgi:alpha-glucosidase
MTFTLGRSLMVAANPKPESPQAYDICLPAGGWYDYWSGLPVAAEKLSETPRIEHLPVFVRAGTILPRQPLVQSTSEVPNGPLSIDIYPGEDCQGILYSDDGQSLAYRRGIFLRQVLRCSATPEGLRIDFAAREGSFLPWWKEIAVTVHGWRGEAIAMLAGHDLAARVNTEAHTVAITIPDQSQAATLVLKTR